MSAQGPIFDPCTLPTYAEEFLGNDLKAYEKMVTAIEHGEPSVSLPKTTQFAKVERTLLALYPQSVLLYDISFARGEGPFSYDAEQQTVEIRYLHGNKTHIALMEAYRLRMEEALSVCKDTMSEYEQAKILYQWVVENLNYEFDLNLTVYDAVITGKGYCQTYSKLYQQLLVRRGIPCLLVGGLVDFDRDGIADAEHQWNQLYIDGQWIIADPTWDAGNLDCFDLSREQMENLGYLQPYIDPADALLR